MTRKEVIEMLELKLAESNETYVAFADDYYKGMIEGLEFALDYVEMIEEL